VINSLQILPCFVVGFELRTWYFLGMCATGCAMPPALSALFFEKGLVFLPKAGLDYDPLFMPPM
jgi:hypothetical protein